MTYRCVVADNATNSSWATNGWWSTDLLDDTNISSCSDTIYNASHELPCGTICDVEVLLFFSCTPRAYEVIVRIVSSIVGATLVFSIVSDLAEVIRGYEMRYCAIQYFSQLTPNQGSLAHKRLPHFGLLPTFDFSTKRNIISWNRIRVFLQTYEQHNFSMSQHKITWILFIPVVFLTVKLYLFVSGNPVAAVAQEDLGDWSMYLLHVDPTPEIIDTLIVKAILLQILGGCLIGHMLYIGVQTTRLHEHDIPHILLLKKAEITAGEIEPVVHTKSLPSLFYSNQKEIVLWCKFRSQVKSKGSNRQEQDVELRQFVRSKIHDIKPQVEDIMGIPTDDFGGLGISVRNHREPKEGGHVPANFEKVEKGTVKPMTDLHPPAYDADGKEFHDDAWLYLLVTVNDGHDIFVDVHDLDDEKKKDELQALAQTADRHDDVVITEVRDISRDLEDLHIGRDNALGGSSRGSGDDDGGNIDLDKQPSRAILEVSPEASEESRLMMHLCRDNAVMQLTSLLDSLIRVIDEERRSDTHAPTIEDTRPALNLPSCCMNYRVGLTTKLFGTIMTMLATSLFSLAKSVLD